MSAELSNKYRPLRIVHDFNFPKSATQNEKKAVIEKRLDDLKNKGYGGIVTNVCFQNYLRSAENWELFEYCVEQAVKRNMRLWIYDEEGYPSGSAGGLTLAANPDFEAKGLVAIIKEVKPGETVKIEKPHGHGKVIAAYKCKVDDSDEIAEPLFYSKPEDKLIDNIIGKPEDLIADVSETGNLIYENRTNSTYALFYFITKKLYEGTHAQHNVHASRRYISLINKNAVAEFIENTYAQYKKHAGKYFGGEIEAFFTDEPWLMPGYLNDGLYPDRVADKYDENIPLLQVVAWEDFLPEKYDKIYPKSPLLHSLHCLFAGTSQEACKIRYRFNKLLSDLYEEAFFAQIGGFCEKAGIQFSGHLLLEESILFHGIYEGNFLNFLKHMGIPGIDMLTTRPDEVLKQAVTPKLAASAANIYGKKHVMTEASGHVETSCHMPFTVKEMLGSIGVQYATGVDIFTTYYEDNYISEADNRIFCEYTSRIGEILDRGCVHNKVAVYYPIESIWLGTKGSAKQLGEREYGSGLTGCEKSWQKVSSLLLSEHVQFDFVNENELFLPNNYEVVVLPSILGLTERCAEQVKKLSESGVRFISTSKTLPYIIGEQLLRCGQDEFPAVFCDIDKLPEFIKSIVRPDIEIADKNIIYLQKHDPSREEEIFLLVNTSDKSVNTEIALSKTFKNVKVFDPYNNTYTNFNETSKLKLEIEGFLGKIIIAH
ncbi:MAG: hypothetical protein LBI03_01525 [Clostridiales bacterium]|jgi:hypothetical protein|nr:hypothetical protein [Clostridiales bacterium]